MAAPEPAGAQHRRGRGLFARARVADALSYGGLAAVRMWWREPADYRWLLSTLRNQAALGLLKFSIGTSALGLSFVVLMLLLSSEGPQNAAGRAVIGLFAVLALLVGLRWYLLPWPSASASLAFIALADLGITINGLLVSSRVAMINNTALILTGGYLALFHSAKALAAHAGWSLFSVLLVTVRLGTSDSDRDVPLAIATTLIMVLAVVLVLPTLQFFYWVLRTNAMSDPLTTLLNRRGLDYHLPRLFAPGAPICAMIIDLDRFKEVNDTFGHQEGDRVLARTAARLRDTTDPAATIARTGGEEFTIVGRLDAGAARALAERLRRAIESSGNGALVTASIGVAVFDDSDEADDRLSPELLLGFADTAMYRAKQRGGNAIVVRELREPLI
ncbi:GGDEF domain-containing protein [Nocardia africana]|uniref:Probable diguanylate cyclase YcdT n=1 Tax=Nocardia africana TaxID=134964 RepID=A0A378X689_9NOCA|nr:GGDEF domain-containing protein [Nocardia africana]MCC3317437.1 GGDEF domain-containing protein [Nocardia africana]SUA48191.1 Probable diguanylate cyclase YcdT [Nocardia africana]